MSISEGLFRANEACQILNVAKSTLFRQIRENSLEPRRNIDLGNSRSFAIDDLVNVGAVLSPPRLREDVEGRCCFYGLAYVAADPGRKTLFEHVLATIPKYPEAVQVMEIYRSQGLLPRTS